MSSQPVEDARQVGHGPIRDDDLPQPLFTGLRGEITFTNSPLPAPKDLEAYDHAMPGLAGQIVEEWRVEARHRREWEDRALLGQERSDRSRWGYRYRGQWFGFSLGLVGLIGGTVVALLGQGAAGAALAGLSLASLVGVFVYGRASE